MSKPNMSQTRKKMKRERELKPNQVDHLLLSESIDLEGPRDSFLCLPASVWHFAPKSKKDKKKKMR